MTPKLVSTTFLDELTRKLCPFLQYFVIFSNGQNCYGMSNSNIENIMKQRHKEGLPSKIIQWNAVDEDEDNKDKEISNMQLNKILFCLDNMDCLMTTNELLVTCKCVAVNKIVNGVKKSIREAVMCIMSIKNNKSISMHTILSELGLNSITAVELRHTLERNHNVYLTSNDLVSLTISSLEKLTNNNSKF